MKIIVLFLVTFTVYSQQKVDSLLKVGNQFYRKKEFLTAAKNWEQASQLVENKISKREYYNYTAMAFAEAKDSTNSFRCLEIAVDKYGFNDLPAITSDESFDFMKQSNRWKKILKSIKIPYTTNPEKVKIINSDITNFWKAHDLAIKNPEKAKEIYMKEYINKGSDALQFYFVNKIDNIENFVFHHNVKKNFYSSIRKQSMKTKKYIKAYKKSFKKLKEIYPEAIFPPIYFVMGKFNSAGTISSDGLILAIDQAALIETTNVSELTIWEKNNISSFQELPYTVAHELIHYEQDGMASSRMLLKDAIEEGMADFIGELISGKTANERLHVYAKGKEKIIWQEFKKEMLGNDSSNWIANADQETAEKPADLGYWVGYQICKSYYDQHSDKKKAIYEMLHIQDYEKFLKDSKIEDKNW
jgi:Predicted Zn-dependent protease (DUF2268)